MNSLPDAIQISKLTRRLPDFFTDRVLITLVLAFLGKTGAPRPFHGRNPKQWRLSGQMDAFRILSGEHHDRLHPGAMDCKCCWC